MSRSCARILCSLVLACAAQGVLGQCPAVVPAANTTVPGPLPLFPADNWWNTDVSAAPVDGNSANFIAFINNGGTRRLHPDFGGEASPGSVSIYGMPYAVVDGSQAKLPVTFQYWDESDGVDYATGQGVPFYPIPSQAIAQAHWIEGGAPGNVDQRSSSDRHLLVLDCTNRHLYELYNVYYDGAQAKWYAGSGAFFDMTANNRRPDTWTSADAAGLAIFPGLVRYDEAWNPAIADIGHAFRVTVRATNGYVYPASHRAGTTAGALPMGARLRLKTNVGGQDPALRTGDPNVQKIFRAMQKYGLIVADNGTDLYITGTFDTRWNNNILNPAFSLLTASDFDVVQLGWKPAASAPALASVSANPTAVVGGNSATGTVTLTAAATASVSVALSSASSAASVPASVTVPAGATSAAFNIATSAVTVQTATSITATYSGISKTTTFTVNPPASTATLASLTLAQTSVYAGTPVTGTVTLSAAAPGSGLVVSLASGDTSLASVPASIVVAAGATSQTFTVTTYPTKRDMSVTLYASYAGITKTASLRVTRKYVPHAPSGK
jgi:hypothetical protein